MNQGLKPCPFCGGRAKVMNGPDDWAQCDWVQCDRCGATTAFSATVESAIAKWNSRVKDCGDEGVEANG